MSKRDAVRTVGGYELARTGKAQTQIAVEVGVSKVTVHQWISGEKRPGKPMREKLMAIFGIRRGGMDVEYKPIVPPPKESTERALDGGEDDEAMQMARALQRQVRTQLDDLEANGETWTKAEKAQVMQRLASSVNVLAKTTGQYELGRRILSLPIWKKIEAELFEAPEAVP